MWCQLWWRNASVQRAYVVHVQLRPSTATESSACLCVQAGTKSKAIELCLLYIEVEDDLGEGVIVSYHLICADIC